jgi:hypothetical protein
MDVKAPISLVTATYGSHDAAAADFDTVWRARDEGEFHHTSVALLTRESEGFFHVERQENTAEYLVWGGALLGGALFVVAPPVGLEVLARGGVSGAGAIVGHLRHNVQPAALARAADVVEQGHWSLVVLVVNRPSAATDLLLEHAADLSSIDMLWGDLEEELSQDFARPLSGAVLVSL